MSDGSTQEGGGCGGCLVTAFFLMLGFSLMAAGCQNYNIKTANPEVRIITIQDLTTTPPEKPIWIEIKGKPAKQSQVELDGASYGVLLDDEGKTGVFIKLAKESTLLSAANDKVVTVRGMALQAKDATSLPSRENVANDIRVGSSIVTENDTPPGWWTSWGLMILGFILMGGPAGKGRSSS